MDHRQSPETIREAVRSRYGDIAAAIDPSLRPPEERLLPVVDPAGGCCSAASCGSSGAEQDAISRDLYEAAELAGLPETAVLASLGCGNPTALAELRPGEVVLDLGSGGGIDVLLSARRVGPTGFAYGLDMTDEMLALAERNRAAARADNVAFLKGHIEQVPLPEHSVDVIISNCVINLSADKAQALREAFRVLKPGGRLAVSDIVVQGRLPETVRRSLELWAGCVAGALEEETYRQLLAEAGFVDVDIEVTRVFDARDACGQAEGLAGFQDELAMLDQSGARVVSAFIRAAKPRR